MSTGSSGYENTVFEAKEMPRSSLIKLFPDPQHSEHLVLTMTHDQLIVMERGSEFFFPYTDIITFEQTHKVLLFPALIGGITCPLALLGLFNHVGSPWFLIFLAFAGLLGIYTGLAGQDFLTIGTHIKDFDFALYSTNRHLSGVGMLIGLFKKYPRLNGALIVEFDREPKAGQRDLAKLIGVFLSTEEAVTSDSSKRHLYKVIEPLTHPAVLFFVRKSDGYRIGMEGELILGQLEKISVSSSLS